MSYKNEKKIENKINNIKDNDNKDISLNLSIENDEKYISLSLKYDRLSRDYNNIKTKLNDTIKINKDNYSKMEQHYQEIIKEKDNKLKELEELNNNKNNQKGETNNNNSI